MEVKDIKPFIEMSNKELFCVLTGDQGVIAQMHLQKLVKSYMAKHEEDADLHTMVEVMLKEEA